MLVLDTTCGNLAIKDAVHAMDKDTRSLFTFDNRKNEKRYIKHTDIPDLRLPSYYADITGPKELHLKNHCTKLIQSAPQTTFKNAALLNHCSIEIMHISHYSSEFIVNISNNTLFIDTEEHELATDTSTNRYLVCAYQQSTYDDHRDEFLTIGVTSSIGHSLNNQLYNFYIDDFIQDLYKIVCNHCAWYDSTCELPNALWQYIAQYTIDCVLPVSYTRSDADEILLNDGQLHVYLDAYLREYHMHATDDDDDSVDNAKKHVIDDQLVSISQIFVEVGRIIDKEYHAKKNKKAIKLKSEYDKWKKQGFKKRANNKPSNMDQLVHKLKVHQHKRALAKDLDAVNELRCLYFINPNFKIKSNKHKAVKVKHSKSTKTKTRTKPSMQSLRKLFAFSNPININYSQTDEVIGDIVKLTPVTATHSQTRAVVHKNKHKTNKMYKYKSVPTAKRKKRFFKKKKKKKKKLNTYMTIDLLYSAMDEDDEESDGKCGVVAAATQSVNVYSKDKKTANKLRPTMNKPLAKKYKSDDVYIKSKGSRSPYSPYSNSSHSPYSHDENVIMFVDMDYKQEEKHCQKRDSVITMKVKQDIGSAYKEYKREKGKIPSDIQAFVNYCKNKKNIKKANWTLCQLVINQFQTNLNSVQE